MFVSLYQQPTSTATGALIAEQIIHSIERGGLRRLEDGPVGGTPVAIGDQIVGRMLDAPLTPGAVWPVVGITDISLAQFAHQLAHGFIPPFGDDPRWHSLPVAHICDIAQVGPVHRLIGSRTARSRGAFIVYDRSDTPVPDYPMLWNHDAKRERELIVVPDTEGQVRDSSSEGLSAAQRIWGTATRAHYNLDFRFNSQSLVAAMTERKSIGGRAWTSIIFANPVHEYAFALWCNSTLGLLMHWWVANKTQSGRGSTTVTSTANVSTLDTRALTNDQHAAAREAFEAMRELRFLPFDQIDEDPARAELDRRLLVDVLGLPASLCEDGGPIDLLRRKLAREPQIHGGKKSRVVFTEDGEKTEKRHDRD